MSDDTIVPLHTHPEPERGRPYVAVFAAPGQAMNVQLATGCGGTLAMYPTVHAVCEHLGKLGMDPTVVRRPDGPAFRGPDPLPGEMRLEFTENHFVFILWFEDGEVELDDTWCRQLRPPQLFFASHLAWIRTGYTLQKEWAGREMAQAAMDRANGTPPSGPGMPSRIVVPRGS